ncbi:hypothetical protein NLU13_5062 [Sarocladium strictum]|uniref:MaoC-like domain-containing protein n=1 Tax=Sarocladium strictum TaxID=5046 RepID=A0AA39L9H6_SARSR|nr:hypothetical protein NLU13_5062 [Sarocladium strictum]
MSEPGVGHKLPTRKVSWLKRDVLLFNLSVGCKADESHFVYENDPKFSPFPTLALGLNFKLDAEEVIDFYATQSSLEIPGVPSLNPERLVDGDRTIQIVKQLPTTSAGREFEFRSTVLGVYDKGRAGTVVRIEDLLVDATSGDVYTRIVGSLFYVGQGGWGGPRGPPATRNPPPEQKPDWVLEIETSEQAAHLYRLNGDYNPLHADPSVGKSMGYGGVIMHGVVAYNMISHEVTKVIGGGHAESLREVSAKFSGPVMPGDTLTVSLWRSGEVDADGYSNLTWVAQVKGQDKPCLTEGKVLVKVHS